SPPGRHDGFATIAMLLAMLLVVATAGWVFASLRVATGDPNGQGAVAHDSIASSRERRSVDPATQITPRTLDTLASTRVPAISAESGFASGGETSFRRVSHGAVPATLRLVRNESTSQPIPDRDALELAADLEASSLGGPWKKARSAREKIPRASL